MILGDDSNFRQNILDKMMASAGKRKRIIAGDLLELSETQQQTQVSLRVSFLG